jgi:threonine/homoserine/homoserine lactone efflux protein
MDVFVVGFLAGLALAIPLGPMAILLITTTVARGRKVAAVAASAMASVDFSYAVLVFTLGKVVISSISEWLAVLRIGGSVLLVLVALRIALNAKKSVAQKRQVSGGSAKTALVTFTTFFGLTVINPATAFYFVGITPSVASMGSEHLVIDALLFGAGVFVGSIIWQSFLVLSSHALSRRLNDRAQMFMQYVGALLIVGLAIWLLLK